MSKTSASIIFILTLIAFFIIAFDYEFSYLFTLLFSLYIGFISAKGIVKKLKAIHLALLGFSVLIFLDIVKFHFIAPKPMSENILQYTIFLSYISFFIFFIAYHFPFKPLKIKVIKPDDFSIKRFEKLVIPLSLILLIVFRFLIILFPNQTKNPLFLLISFLPKATLVILFFLYISKRKKRYLKLILFFLLLSFTESSRRIYVTLFVITLSIFMGYYIFQNKKMQRSIKFLILFASIIFFFFLNFLRSEHDFGVGYEKNALIANTIEYIITLKSLDTFYNTAYVIDNFPRKYIYYYGETYSSVLFMFVPRIIWSDKPVSFAAQLGVLERTGNRDFTLEEWRNTNMFSLSPGFIGEAFANFGLIGVLILSFLFGVVTKKFDSGIHISEVFRNINVMPYLSFLAIFFLLLRGDFFAAVYYSIFYFIYLKLIIKICKVPRINV